MQSKEILRKTPLLLIQFPLMVTSCKTIVWYHKQDIDIHAVHWLYSDFPRLLVLLCMRVLYMYVCAYMLLCGCCLCVCVVLCTFITFLVSCILHQSKFWIISSLIRSLMLLFYNHIHCPLAPSYLHSVSNP